MTIQSVLVHVPVPGAAPEAATGAATGAADPVVAFAVELANRFEARLVGVGAHAYVSAFDVGGYAGDGVHYGAGAMIVANLASIEADLDQARTRFAAAAASVRGGTDWRSRMAPPAVVISAEARAADLIVLAGAGNAESHDAAGVAGAVALSAGRPVLVAPAAAPPGLERVLIAWKDTREARRAVADALPLLKRAQSVHILEVCDPDAATDARARVADVAAHLARHGVRADADAAPRPPGSGSAETLLAATAGTSADLIVAGAYGHSRLREWVLGGFTRALLAQTERAVLLSH